MYADTTVRIVAMEFDIPYRLLISADRRQHVARARIAAMWCVRKLHPDLSLHEIGRLFGNRHHTTVMYALARAEDRIMRESRFAAKVQKVVTAGQASELERSDPVVQSFLVEAGL